MITICNQISVLEIQVKLKCIKNNRTIKRLWQKMI